MKSNCINCVHNKVCRLKNVCERISKKLDDSLDITTDEKESFEVGQFTVELKCKDYELAVPRTKGISDILLDTLPKGSNLCEGCPTYEMLNSGQIYVGDLPCQWCDKNPHRATCSSAVVTQ